MALAVIAAVVLLASTACSSSGHSSAGGAGGAYAVLAILALGAGIVLLSAVGRMVGQLVKVLTELAAGLAKMGLLAVLMIGAVIVAFAVVAQS